MSKRDNRQGSSYPADPARVDPPEPGHDPLPPALPESDAGAVNPPFVEPFEPALPIPPVSQADRDNAAMAEPVELEQHTKADPPKTAKVLPEGAVRVKAKQGLAYRVEHRAPGDEFWMLGPDAEDFIERGWVEKI